MGTRGRPRILKRTFIICRIRLSVNFRPFEKLGSFLNLSLCQQMPRNSHRLYEKNYHPPKYRPGFMMNAMTSTAAELPLSLFGVRFLMNQRRKAPATSDNIIHVEENPIGPGGAVLNSTDPFTNLQFYTPGVIESTWALAAVGGLPMLFLIGDSIVASSELKQERAAIVMLSIWIPIVLIYWNSWRVWPSFLAPTPNDVYCVEDTR